VRLDEYIECGTRSADGARAVAGDELSTILSKPPPPPGGVSVLSGFQMKNPEEEDSPERGFLSIKL